MLAFTWPGQAHRDHVVNDDEKICLTGWRLGCPNCGELIAASPAQHIHEVSDLHAGGRMYAQLSTICLHCNCRLTELWSIN